MKQSYIYKFIFLCNFLFGANTLQASINNFNNSCMYFPSWNLSKFHFANCTPTLLSTDGVNKSISIPYYNGEIATCNQGQTIEFMALQDQLLLQISEVNVSYGYLYASLYKIENSNNIYLRKIRISDINSLTNLEIGSTYQLVLFQNYSDQINVTTSLNLHTFFPSPLNNGPYIQVNTTNHSINELVTDVLISNECVQVSNISWASGDVNNPSIGYFDGNGSIFPFEDGIVLTTGAAVFAEGPISTVWQEASFDNGLLGDQDLTNILGLQGSITNTTRLEFDFVPVSNQISFNFIFASNEYGTFQCDYSDVFAFILTDLATGITTNLAVVPNTTTPIAVTTIRDSAHNGGCLSVNPEYFDSFYTFGSTIAPINFHGHTVALTATSAVVPGTAYHIKLAIADFGPWGPDSGYDSAVFIEGGSFDMGNIDLGDDLLEADNNALCFDDDYLIQSGIDPNLYTIQWYLNGVAITGATQPDYLATESGTYKVEAQFIGTDCSINDEIIIEMYPRIREILNQPENIEICSNNQSTVDLTELEADVLGNYPATDFIFEYYLTLTDLQNQTNPIANPQAYTPQGASGVYMNIISTSTNCSDYFKINVTIKPLPEVTTINDVLMCNNFQLPELRNDETYYTGPNRTGIQYFPGDILKIGTYQLYIYREFEGCTAESEVEIQIINCEIPKGISPNNDDLNDYFDLTYYGVIDLKIFNRYGKEVYSHGLGYTNEWKGQDNNGNDLPDGTYYYSIITLLDRFEGWIQVNR